MTVAPNELTAAEEVEGHLADELRAVAWPIDDDGYLDALDTQFECEDCIGVREHGCFCAARPIEIRTHVLSVRRLAAELKWRFPTSVFRLDCHHLGGFVKVHAMEVGKAPLKE